MLTVTEILPVLITSVLTHALAPVVNMLPVLLSTIYPHVSAYPDMWAMLLKSALNVSMSFLIKLAYSNLNFKT